jgi:hypothetical protein
MSFFEREVVELLLGLMAPEIWIAIRNVALRTQMDFKSEQLRLEVLVLRSSWTVYLHSDTIQFLSIRKEGNGVVKDFIDGRWKPDSLWKGRELEVES